MEDEKVEERLKEWEPNVRVLNSLVEHGYGTQAIGCLIGLMIEFKIQHQAVTYALNTTIPELIMQCALEDNTKGQKGS